MSEEKNEAQATEKEYQPVVMGIDPAELVKLVSVVVGQTLAPVFEKLNPLLERLSTPSLDADRLGAVIGQNVANGIASTQRRKVSIGEYLAKPHSPNRKDINAKLKRVCMQNGFYLSESVLTDNEIYLLNEITHSGRYCDRFVEVAVLFEEGNQQVDIRFSNATADQRFALREHVEYSPRRHGSVFEALLEMIVEDQKLERSEREVESAMKDEVRAIARERLERQRSGETPQEPEKVRAAQGHVGQSKAYLEAKARAEAKRASAEARNA